VTSWWTRCARGVAALPALLLIGLIRGYQLVLSPMLGPSCRFYPSCSAYGLGAVRTHGALKGSLLAGARICRCNPWNLGGVDPVPPRGRWRNEPQGAQVGEFDGIGNDESSSSSDDGPETTGAPRLEPPTSFASDVPGASSTTSPHRHPELGVTP